MKQTQLYPIDDLYSNLCILTLSHKWSKTRAYLTNVTTSFYEPSVITPQEQCDDRAAVTTPVQLIVVEQLSDDCQKCAAKARGLEHDELDY